MSRLERVVVVGADAAGMSAAHQAIRSARAHGRELEVVAFEKTQHTSYSACGLPYWIAGEVPEYEELVARSPEEHRRMGIDLHTGTEVTAIDPLARTVAYRTGERVAETIRFDQLIIATGAKADVPPWARLPDGRIRGGVGVVKDITDGQAWIERLTRTTQKNAGRPSGDPVVVVGGGYIGLEMAEAAMSRGHDVVLVTRSRVMSSLDPGMSERVENAIAAAGVAVLRHATVVAASSGDDGGITGVTLSTGDRIACAAVVVATGVRPALDFLADAGLPTGRSGGLQPDETGAVAPGIWAAGDCCETRHRVTGNWVFLPLGTHANKQGKTVGVNIGGGSARFAGVLGTAITRFVSAGAHVEIARTGLALAEAQAAGLDPVALATDGRTASGYMPEATLLAVNVIADRSTRRLLGAQIVGGERSAKRIDTIAASLWGGLSVDDLAGMDLAYAPPFATVWEAVQLAARRLADRL